MSTRYSLQGDDVPDQMTPEEFTEALAYIGLNNSSAARHLTKSRRTIIRYQYPTTDPRNSRIPGPVARTVRRWVAVHRQRRGE